MDERQVFEVLHALLVRKGLGYRSLFWLTGFFLLFTPSMVNYLVPAAIMSFAMPAENPAASEEQVMMQRGAKCIMFLFGCSIATAVSFHNFLHPPFLGMMIGYHLKKTHRTVVTEGKYAGAIGDVTPVGQQDKMFDFFNRLARAEWDTLLFSMAW